MLVPFNPDYLDDSAMWTGSSDLAHGFGYIRTLSDICLKLGAVLGDKGHSATVRLSHSGGGDVFRWKILPWSGTNAPCGGLAQSTFRIYCKANEGLSVTIRNGTVCLDPANPNDEYQHWVEDTRYGDVIRDQDGSPALALVNRRTGDAIKQSVGQSPVKLVPYNPYYLDKSILWSKSADMGHGFQCIRAVDDIYLNLGAFPCKEHSIVQDGTQVVLSDWCEDDNQHWRMVPWCK